MGTDTNTSVSYTGSIRNRKVEEDLWGTVFDRSDIVCHKVLSNYPDVFR